MSFPLSDSSKLFGPEECWCTQHGQVFYPCKNNKLCKSTNERFKKLKEKYLKSKKNKNKKDKKTKRRSGLQRSKRRQGYNVKKSKTKKRT